MSKAETARHDADEDGDVMASMIELGLLDVELMDDGEPELCLTEKGTRLVPELGRRWLLAHRSLTESVIIQQDIACRLMGQTLLQRVAILGEEEKYSPLYGTFLFLCQQSSLDVVYLVDEVWQEIYGAREGSAQRAIECLVNTLDPAQLTGEGPDPLCSAFVKLILAHGLEEALQEIEATRTR